MALSSTKDVLCTAAFVVYITLFWRLLSPPPPSNRRSFHVICLFASLAGVFASLLRNNMIYAIAAGGLLAVCFYKDAGKRGRLRLLLFVSLTCVFSSLANRAALHISSALVIDPYRESLSMPLQGMARAASYRRDELPRELREELLLYLLEEGISGYNPFLSDGVKNTANEELLRENTFNFFKLWAKIGWHFPAEYIESLMSNTLGYWYLLNLPYWAEMGLSRAQLEEVPGGEKIVYHDYAPWYRALFGWLYLEESTAVPVTGFLQRTVFYVWLMIFCVFVMIWKRARNALLFSLTLLAYFGTCLLGPCASFRYMYCVTASIPFLLYVLAASLSKTAGRNRNEETVCLLSKLSEAKNPKKP